MDKICNKINKEHFYIENKIDLLDQKIDDEIRRSKERKKNKIGNKSDLDEDLIMLYNFYATISRIFEISPIPKHSISKLENNFPRALVTLLTKIKEVKYNKEI